MEWLPFAFVTIVVASLCLYGIIKWAIKDALKEYFRDKEK